VITVKWASMLGTIIGLVVCPILLLLGVGLLLFGKKK